MSQTLKTANIKLSTKKNLLGGLSVLVLIFQPWVAFHTEISHLICCAFAVQILYEKQILYELQHGKKSLRICWMWMKLLQMLIVEVYVSKIQFR